MKMVLGFMGAAVGLGVFGQMSGGDAARMIDEELGRVATDPLIRTAAEQANVALGSGLASPFVIVTVAAMPVILHVAKALSAMADREHELSVQKRKKAAGVE